MAPTALARKLESRRLQEELYYPVAPGFDFGAPDAQEHYIIAELDEVASLTVRDGVITTAAVKGLRFNSVKEMRVYGDHEAHFPRERVRFTKPGERPVESITTEQYPQTLVVRGAIRPRYKVKDTKVDLGHYQAEGEISGSELEVLTPTPFSIWAEYVSPEEQVLLKSMRGVKLVSGTSDPVKAYFATLAFGMGECGLLFGAFGTMLSLMPVSPNVALTFADGRQDRDTGAQVVRFDGKVYPDQARIETDHYPNRESVRLPDRFSVDGSFFVEGKGRVQVPGRNPSSYAGAVSGSLSYKQGKAFLVGNTRS